MILSTALPATILLVPVTMTIMGSTAAALAAIWVYVTAARRSMIATTKTMKTDALIVVLAVMALVALFLVVVLTRVGDAAIITAIAAGNIH